MNSFTANRNEFRRTVNFLQLFEVANFMQKDASIFASFMTSVLERNSNSSVESRQVFLTAVCIYAVT